MKLNINSNHQYAIIRHSIRIAIRAGICLKKRHIRGHKNRHSLQRFTMTTPNQNPLWPRQNTRDWPRQSINWFRQNAQPDPSEPSDDIPTLEPIHVMVAFDVTKDNTRTRYTQSLHIPYPDSLDVLRGRLQAMHWWMQAAQGEVWSWASPDLHVVWTGVPYETVMRLDNWRGTLIVMYERNRGDYIRIDMNYERQGLL